jgi:hypothetical protein
MPRKFLVRTKNTLESKKAMVYAVADFLQWAFCDHPTFHDSNFVQINIRLLLINESTLLLSTV